MEECVLLSYFIVFKIIMQKEIFLRKANVFAIELTPIPLCPSGYLSITHPRVAQAKRRAKTAKNRDFSGSRALITLRLKKNNSDRKCFPKEALCNRGIKGKWFRNNIGS